MTIYAAPGQPDSLVDVQSRYGHYIGGEWVSPAKGQYFENISPVNGKPFTEIARGTEEDIEAALDAAHAAFPAWKKTSTTERANLLNKIADRLEENLEAIAVAESYDNGKPVRETLAADIPLTIDHFRYFASAIRAQEGSAGELDENTVAYHFHEPLGVVGQIIPWNFPILMAAWKLAPALAAGNCVVLKPAEQTPWSILKVMELIGDLLPAGVLNVVNGFGVEAGKPLATSSRIAKVAFTGETTTGRLIMQYAAENIIPVTLELGGKSPNIFFDSVATEKDAFYDKAQEGFTLFALNQGEVCTCPSRALIQDSIYDEFLADAVVRTEKIVQGNPLDTTTMIGAQASLDQLEKILSYIEIGKAEGAKVLTGGERNVLEGDLAGGYYVKPTIFEGHNKMRIFQEEIFGPVVSVARFADEAEALETANDTLYGLGAGVWSREGSQAYRAGREIEAGRVWTNCYHLYPAGAAFGGYKQSGIGRETHKMMLDHYQQTKNLLVSYSPDALGFF
ncbi:MULTISPECIES: aldehyde dehydrogenase family protein [unclassified Nocardioides]|uniref:acetaldehyde dehydrogenase ExaC n=1 Tax=unclassified Nocardioides TaxID=2615069 RepID=UPI001151E687|nr:MULTISPECIES: aldehyde dehydrogenase family protein [unclassified Nocardioides]TQK69073.1 aldehyde dehydrogenase [Nocardioides sp. SLBN-35]WGY01621.1 aldehyde dehydrogenase family protein [Nocardioides sp. QY071]